MTESINGSRIWIFTGSIIWWNIRLRCVDSCVSSNISALFCLKMVELGLEFVLHGVNQEPERGGINPAIGITKSVVRLIRTVFRPDANNNFPGMCPPSKETEKILDRVRGRGGGEANSSCAEKIRELLQAEMNDCLV